MADYKKLSKEEAIKRLQKYEESPYDALFEANLNTIYNYTRLASEDINIEDDDADKKMQIRGKAALEAANLIEVNVKLKSLMNPDMKLSAENMEKRWAEKMADFTQQMIKKREQDIINRKLLHGNLPDTHSR